MKLSSCLFLLLTAEAAKRGGRKKERNNNEVKQSAWAKFTKSIGDDLKSHMIFPGIDLFSFLPDIMAAYQDDHPESNDKIEAMKKDFEDGEGGTGPRGLRSGAGGGIERMAGLTNQDKMHMMKYLQLKYTILFLQKNKFIGKYCFYGCWCLPAGAGFDKQGFGSPIDNIDKSCREFTTCYNCLYNPAPFHGENCNEFEAMQQRYNIQGSADQQTGAITLFCTDPQGTCQRSRCECDKALSEKLEVYESEWNMQNHHKWGNPPFVPQHQCGSRLATPQQTDASVSAAAADGAVAAASFTGVSDGASKAQSTEQKDSIGRLTALLATIQQAQSETAANGDLIINVSKGSKKDRPVTVVQSAPIYGAIIGCCGRAPNVHYYRDGQRCCVDGEIVDVNAPCSMEFM